MRLKLIVMIAAAVSTVGFALRGEWVGSLWALSAGCWAWYALSLEKRLERAIKQLHELRKSGIHGG